MSTSKPKFSTEYVLSFAKKMKSVAIRVLIFAIIVAAPIIWSSGSSPTTFVFIASRVIEIIVWSYLAMILFQFYRRTQLKEYLLHAHTYWLAGVIAFPITYLLGGILFLFRSALPSNLYTGFGFAISAIWLVLALVGKASAKRRTDQLENELQNNVIIWKRLQKMNVKSIALLQFPASSELPT